jgi:predicted signal transduction protein with EAL and GGDEF domain
MKTATGLTLIVIGAILAFAVTTNTSVFNLHIAGYVLILAGLAGMFIPRRNYAAVSRRLVTTRRSRRWPDGTVTQTREIEVPPYVVINPNSPPEDVDLPTVPSIPPDPTVGTVMSPGASESEVVEQLRDE